MYPIPFFLRVIHPLLSLQGGFCSEGGQKKEVLQNATPLYNYL
jgi:hypothetical protein